MDATRHSIELPDELADDIRARVESGEYASESDVVREALDLLRDRDTPLDDWVGAELATAYDAWKAEPSKVYTIKEVRARLDERRRRRA